MADLIPPMLIKLQADVNDLKVGLAQAENALKGVDNSVKTASTGMTNFMATIKKVGATMGVAFAGQQIVQFGKDVIMAASDMNESLGKVNVVFGDNSKQVIAWSQTSAQAMGLSSQKALEAAGTYGNLFQAFGLGQGQAQDMSTSLVQLAADMASFNNTSIDDAILALRSGLSGETEPLKRFGVALNDVRLKEQAMSMGLIKSTSGVLPVAAKAQAAYALILHDTVLAQGDYARTADGAANTMRSLAAEFQNAKVALGNALLPAFRALLAVLKLVVPLLTAIGKFFTNNADALRIYGILVAGLVLALKGYKAILISLKITQEAFAVAQAIMTGTELASIASTNGLAASMLKLNAVMKANPFLRVVTIVIALGAAFVWAWKHSETFRGVVIKAAQGVLYALAAIINGFGKLFGIIGKIPGMGWAKGLSKGAEDFAEKINIAGRNLADLKTQAAGYGEGAFTYGSGTGTGTGTGTKPGAGAGKLTDAEKKKLEGYKKDVENIYKDMTKAIENANKKASEAVLARDEDIAKARKRFAEQAASAEQTRDRATLEAQKDLAKKKIEIAKTYAQETAKIQENLDTKLADLREKANTKIADLNKTALQKQASIVQQSIDRLRNAFASKTGFDIAEAFKEGGSADRLIATLKDKLQAAKDLQDNAAALAGLGYSQVFIEEIVKNGPEAGNEIAKALRGASPEATKELQSLYNQVETISAHGLDALATTMNAGANLATEELLNAYNQVSVDLKDALETVNVELYKNMADAQVEFDKAMVEATTKRDEALAEAEAALEEALAKIRQNFDDSMIDASKSLEEALVDAQKQFEKSMQDITDTITSQLNDLMDKLAEAAAAMNQVQSGAANGVISNAPTFGGFKSFDYSQDPNNILKYSTNPYEREAAAKALGITINAPVTVTTNASGDDIATAIMNQAKYGMAVV